METAVLNKQDDRLVRKEDRREQILNLESALSKMPGAVIGDSDAMPLKHSFADGMYVREIFIPKGFVLTGKIHRHSHPNFLMSGEVIVVTENGGRERLKGPLSMISSPGTKRAIVALEDTVWITVHATNETDLEKIEDYVIAKSYDDPLLLANPLETRNCLILALKEKGRNYESLLGLKAEGTLLPFKESLEKLRQEGVSLDGLFVSKTGDTEWHVTTKEGLPLGDFLPSETDKVGSWVAVGVGGATVVGSYLGSKGKGKTVSQGPLETPEQTEARRRLLAMGNDPGYMGPIGSYDMTGAEQAGQGILSGLLGSARPELLGIGGDEIKKLLTTSAYDPNNDGGVYRGLTDGIDYNTQKAIDATKRGASFAGNLYSTDTYRNIGDVNVQAANNKSNILAQLYQHFGDQKLNAIPQAIQAGQAQESIDMGRVDASQRYGALARTLADQQVKDKYNAWMQEQDRKRANYATVVGSQPEYGASSMTVPGDSGPWGKVLDALTNVGGNFVGRQLYDKYGGGSGYMSPYSPLALGGR